MAFTCSFYSSLFLSPGSKSRLHFFGVGVGLCYLAVTNILSCCIPISPHADHFILFNYPSVCLSCWCVCLSVSEFSINLSVCLSGCLTVRVSVCLSVGLLSAAGIRACDSPLGVSNGNIPDSSLTAEDYSTSNNRPKYGRLNRTIGYGGWCGINSVTNPNDYFQVDLGNVTYVSAVATQGIIDGHPLGSNAELYTTRYMVKIRNSSSGAWTVLSNIVGAARDVSHCTLSE